jgi:hypothetical protein
MSTPPSSPPQLFSSVDTPFKPPHKVLCPTRSSDPLIRAVEGIAWDTFPYEDDRFTFPTGFPIDLDNGSQWGSHWEPVPGCDEPQFKLHDLAEYHPDPNVQAHVCRIVDVCPVLNGQVALYGICFADGSMRVSVPQYDLHPLTNIVF